MNQRIPQVSMMQVLFMPFITLAHCCVIQSAHSRDRPWIITCKMITLCNSSLITYRKVLNPPPICETVESPQINLVELAYGGKRLPKLCDSIYLFARISLAFQRYLAVLRLLFDIFHRDLFAFTRHFSIFRHLPACDSIYQSQFPFNVGAFLLNLCNIRTRVYSYA